MDKLSVIHEGYVGDSITLPALEALSKYRKKYATDTLQRFNKKILANDDIYTDPLLIKFNREIEKIFGFSTFVTYISDSMMPNAYTYPITYSADVVNLHDHTKFDSKRGYYFDSKCDLFLSITINSGLIFDNRLTDREVMAIIIHEIGHNFSTGVSTRSALIGDIQKSILAVRLILYLDISYIVLLNSTSKALDGLRNHLYENYPDLMKFMNRISRVFSEIQQLNYEFINILRVIWLTNPASAIVMALISGMVKLLRALQYPTGFVRLLTGYENEQFADAFAAMYGYAKDLASGLNKFKDMNLNSNAIMRDKLKVFNNYITLMKMPTIIVITSLDEHPDDAARVKNNLRALESAYKTADPKAKARIKRDIDETTKMYSNYLKVHNASMASDPDYVYKLYSGFLFNSLDGDLRHNIYDSLFKHNETLGLNKVGD